jgi:hypothetical protein
MDSSYNHFKSLWRSSANEAVAYSDDFSEALLVLPELIDGALGDGKATEINIIVKLSDDKSELILKDNGSGITSIPRLLNWAATQSASTEHVYGHGSKKCLTKFMPDYDTADWSIMWRKVDKRGVSGSLNIIKNPFLGNQTYHEEDEKNDTDLMISGTQWTINFNKDILRLDKSNSSKPEAEAKELMTKLKEIICTRYEKSFYYPFLIKVVIINGSTIIKDDSSKWLTLKDALFKSTPNVVKMLYTKYNLNINNNNICIECDMYKIISDGRKFKLIDFPLYGVKNIKGTRVHIGLNGRYIEAMPLNVFKERDIHNSENGIIIFINFSAADKTANVKLPTPCTTKVKFQEECPIFKDCLKSIREKVLEAQKKFSQSKLEDDKSEDQESEENSSKDKPSGKQPSGKQPSGIKKVVDNNPPKSAEQIAAEKEAAKKKAAEEKAAREKAEADKKAKELLLEITVSEIINKISADNKNSFKNYINTFGTAKFIKKFK